MTWTRTVPTDPGFYWARYHTKDELDSDTIVEIEQWIDGPSFTVMGNEQLFDDMPDYEFWPEKLKPPPE